MLDYIVQVHQKITGLVTPNHERIEKSSGDSFINIYFSMK
ncbi:hypothetical protein BTN49_2402 [Candidatus Enterovibrio escicola]|uniref:Uncharacterized protein n=1 Tax=Candidatus Enterovibrio escicola TaxID=1927127 RepID=A0A2A5T197_9GAMM|nr:hypothetical protein BTN49_2402 [Candidatus Enterovibrio escacola]